MAGLSIFVVFGFLISAGNCDLTCENPPISADVFVDWNQFVTFFIQTMGVTQTPRKCSLPYDNCTCVNQICCTEEVGCCYTDPTTGSQTCGCRGVNEQGCPRPAPVVVIKNSVCEPHNSAAVSMCIRRKNLVGYAPPFVTRKSLLDPEIERAGSKGTTSVDYTDNYQVRAMYHITSNGDASTKDLDQFTAEMLNKKLNPQKLDKLFDLMQQERMLGPFQLQTP